MRKGAHALLRERVYVPELCRTPQYGSTPLHLAAEKGVAAVVDKLLEAGAATDTLNKVTGKGG